MILGGQASETDRNSKVVLLAAIVEYSSKRVKQVKDICARGVLGLNWNEGRPKMFWEESKKRVAYRIYVTDRFQKAGCIL